MVLFSFFVVHKVALECVCVCVNDLFAKVFSIQVCRGIAGPYQRYSSLGTPWQTQCNEAMAWSGKQFGTLNCVPPLRHPRLAKAGPLRQQD